MGFRLSGVDGYTKMSNGAPEKHTIEYPCRVVNRFQCPYERINSKEEDVVNIDSNFDIEDLFRLQKWPSLLKLHWREQGRMIQRFR
jgi:hypothetical protein